MPQCQCSKHPLPSGAVLVVIQRQEVAAGLLQGLPASLCCPCWCQLLVILADDSTSLWPVLKLVCVSACTIVPGYGWASVRSMLKLGALFWLPCSEMTQHGDGAGHCLYLPASQTQPAPSLCSATVHPSLQWGVSASHFHSLCKHSGVGLLTHTGGEKCVLLPHVTGLCALPGPRVARLCWGSTEPLCPASTLHKEKHFNPCASSSELQLLGASRCCCGCPALPRPWVAPGALWQRVSLGGGGGPATQGKVLAEG